MIDKIDIFSCHNHINEQLFRRNCFEYFGYFGCFGLNCRENREYYHPHPIRDLSVPRNYHHPPATFPYPQVLVTKYDQGMPCCTLLWRTTLMVMTMSSMTWLRMESNLDCLLKRIKFSHFVEKKNNSLFYLYLFVEHKIGIRRSFQRCCKPRSRSLQRFPRE